MGELVTLHLDNRMAWMSLILASAYRASYKGRVLSVEDDWALLAPRECVLMHGFAPVVEIAEPGYAFPADPRTEHPVPVSPLQHMPRIEGRDRENKVGVLITQAQEQPHTTVLAFYPAKTTIFS